MNDKISFFPKQQPANFVNDFGTHGTTTANATY